MHKLLCIINHQNVVIKTTHKTLGGSKYSKNIKISKTINHQNVVIKQHTKALGGVSTAKISKLAELLTI